MKTKVQIFVLILAVITSSNHQLKKSDFGPEKSESKDRYPCQYKVTVDQHSEYNLTISDSLTQYDTWTQIFYCLKHTRTLLLSIPISIEKRHQKFLILLLLCGDISQYNPGPGRQPKHPCTFCSKGVIATSKAVSCDTCDQWTHIKCTGYISEAKYKILSIQDGDFTFYCRKRTFDFLPDSNFLCEINPERLDISQRLPSEANCEQFQCFLQKGLHFLHLNARSLLPKILLKNPEQR